MALLPARCCSLGNQALPFPATQSLLCKKRKGHTRGLKTGEIHGMPAAVFKCEWFFIRGIFLLPAT